MPGKKEIFDLKAITVQMLKSIKYDKDERILGGYFLEQYTSQGLTTLDLSHTDLSYDDIRHLSNALKTYQAFETLNLSGTLLGKLSSDEPNPRQMSYALEHLGAMLKVNRRLKTLLLSNNEIDDEGLNYFCLHFYENTGLMLLELSNNKISNHGMHCLAAALRSHHRDPKEMKNVTWLVGNNLHTFSSQKISLLFAEALSDAEKKAEKLAQEQKRKADAQKPENLEQKHKPAALTQPELMRAEITPAKPPKPILLGGFGGCSPTKILLAATTAAIIAGSMVVSAQHKP